MKTLFSKITAAILVVMMMFSIVPVMGLELSSQAAEKVTFSLNLAEETSTQVVLTVKLDSGSFGAVDFGVTYNSAKVKKCTKITGNTDIALGGGVQQFYAPTGLGSIAVEPAYDKAGSVIATYTFEKNAGTNVTKDDFALKVSNCDDATGAKASVTVKNTLPTEQPTQKPTQKPTESTKPTEKPTESTKPTQKPTEPTKPTQKPTESTKPTQKPTDPTKPTQKPTSTTATTPTTVPSSTEATTVLAVSNGKCGDNAEWYFDETTGTLVISGSGDMWDYSAVEPEWVTKHGIYIKEVTISYGITSIGAGSFKNCLNLETVYIPSSVVRIGAGAFDGCYNLKNVYYEGTEEDFRNLFPQAESIFGSTANFNFDSSIVVDGNQYEDMTDAENEPENPADKLGIDKNTLIIIIAVVALLIVVVAVLLVLKSKKKKAPAKEQEVKAEEEPFQYQDPNQFQAPDQFQYVDPFQQYQNQNNDQNDQK